MLCSDCGKRHDLAHSSRAVMTLQARYLLSLMEPLHGDVVIHAAFRNFQVCSDHSANIGLDFLVFLTPYSFNEQEDGDGAELASTLVHVAGRWPRQPLTLFPRLYSARARALIDLPNGAWLAPRSVRSCVCVPCACPCCRVRRV